MSKLQRGAICVLIAAAFSGGAVAAPCGEPSLSASAIVPGAPITLRAVMDEIANAAPQVRRAALETKAREAEVNQAGRRPNPVVGVELENFAGSGPLSGFGETETTFSFEQTFELGNKRSLRREAANANAALASAECGAILRQTQLEAAILFYELDAAVQVADFANESALLAQTLVETVSKRVNAEPERRPSFPARAQMLSHFRRLPKVQKPVSKVCVMISPRCGATPHLNFPRPSPKPRHNCNQLTWTRVKSPPILYLIWRARRRW